MAATNLFYAAIAEVLEVEAVDFDTEFRQVEGWCSLQGFGILVTMENDWHAPIAIERFLAIRTVGELYLEAFLAFAASILGVERSRLTGDTAYGSLAEWDSVSHLRLVMESEARFGVQYPLERIPALTTLRDFVHP